MGMKRSIVTVASSSGPASGAYSRSSFFYTSLLCVCVCVCAGAPHPNTHIRYRPSETQHPPLTLPPLTLFLSLSLCLSLFLHQLLLHSFGRVVVQQQQQQFVDRKRHGRHLYNSISGSIPVTGWRVRPCPAPCALSAPTTGGRRRRVRCCCWFRSPESRGADRGRRVFNRSATVDGSVSCDFHSRGEVDDDWAPGKGKKTLEIKKHQQDNTKKKKKENESENGATNKLGQHYPVYVCVYMCVSVWVLSVADLHTYTRSVQGIAIKYSAIDEVENSDKKNTPELAPCGNVVPVPLSLSLFLPPHRTYSCWSLFGDGCRVFP